MWSGSSEGKTAFDLNFEVGTGLDSGAGFQPAIFRKPFWKNLPQLPTATGQARCLSHYRRHRPTSVFGIERRNPGSAAVPAACWSSSKRELQHSTPADAGAPRSTRALSQPMLAQVLSINASAPRFGIFPGDTTIIMKILLILPAGDRVRVTRANPVVPKRAMLRFSVLPLTTVAALTPRNHAVRVLDENVEPLDFETECDLVGITFMTALAPRAYEIAHEFRARGKIVVGGGYHATLCPDEAANHFDAIVAGDAEGAWERVLADVGSRAVQLRPRRRASSGRRSRIDLPQPE